MGIVISIYPKVKQLLLPLSCIQKRSCLSLHKDLQDVIENPSSKDSIYRAQFYKEFKPVDVPSFDISARVISVD